MGNRKPIKTNSLNRFLKAEFEDGQFPELADVETVKKLYKKDVNTCKHCGVKYWNNPRCKCDII